MVLNDINWKPKLATNKQMEKQNNHEVKQEEVAEDEDDQVSESN